MPKLALSIATALALAIVGVAVAGSAGTAYTYRAALTPGGEVPKPKAPAAAKGVFTATVTESGSTRTISWKLTFQRPERKGGCSAHPQGQARRRRRA